MSVRIVATSSVIEFESSSTTQPRVITHALGHWPAMRFWSPEYFSKNFAEHEIRVATCPDYKQGESSEIRLSLGALMNLIYPLPSRPLLYLRQWPIQFWPASLSQDVGLLAGEGRVQSLHAQWHLWVGAKGVSTPYHTDDADNLHAQIYGTKHFLLYPPHIAEEVAITKPSGEPKMLAGVDVFSCALKAGEVLFLPAGWGHYVVTLSTSISVNSWFAQPISINAE